MTDDEEDQVAAAARQRFPEVDTIRFRWSVTYTRTNKLRNCSVMAYSVDGRLVLSEGANTLLDLLQKIPNAIAFEPI